jgi:thiol:disulfide interchange protein
MNARAFFTIVVTFTLLTFASSRPAAAQPGGQTHLTVRAVAAADGLARGQQSVLAVVAQINPGLHAQSHMPLDAALIAYEVTLDNAAGIEAMAPQYPAGTVEQYPALGKLSVYTGQVIVYVPVRIAADAALGPIKITGTVSCQICDDKQCFMPEDVTFSTSTRIVLATEKLTVNESGLFSKFDATVFAAGATTQAGASAAPARSPMWTVLGVAVGDSTILVLLLALFIGVIFNLMPCVLPVLPLKAIGFYEAAQHGRARSIFLGACFSAGIIATFGVLAVLVIVLRKLQWGEQFSNPIFIWTIVVILVVMAAGMFGAFALRLPTAVYNFTPRHDSVSGNFAFGALSAVLSTPCTAPLFPQLLIWAVKVPQWLGVAAVLTVGVGMALPYVALSALPGLARRVPRTGPWAELLKEMLGFLLLGSAAYFAGGATLGVRGAVWGAAIVVAAAGLFLIGRTLSFTRKALPVVMATVVAVVLTGSACFAAARITTPSSGGADAIPWEPYSQAAFDKARASGRITIVEFTAAWCTNCLALEATTFHDARSGKAVRDANAIALRADLTDRHAEGWKRLGELNAAGGVPLTAIYKPGSDTPEELASLYTVQELVDAIGRARAGH